MSTVVSIHQPNYLPWLGYFNKLANSDVHVFLDDVEFSKNSFINRNRIWFDGKPTWLTIPVFKKYHKANIQDVPLPEDDSWKNRHLVKIEKTYKNYPYFEKYFPVLKWYLTDAGMNSLAELNISLIMWLADELNIASKIRFELSSSLEKDNTKKKTDRLVEIVKAVGGTTYLSGEGGKGYLDVEAFGDIDVQWQSFEYPLGFSADMTVLDVLFAKGPDCEV